MGDVMNAAGNADNAASEEHLDGQRVPADAVTTVVGRAANQRRVRSLDLAGTSGGLSAEDGAFRDATADIAGSFHTVFPATIAAGANDIQHNILARNALGLR